MSAIIHLSSIADLCRLLRLPNNTHPLVAVVDFGQVREAYPASRRITTDFYSVMFKNDCHNTVKYGRKHLDFQDGSLICMAPHQILEMDADEGDPPNRRGWGLFFHPDLLRAGSLGEQMKSYSFFTYAVTEALHLSDKEKHILRDCVQKIAAELQENIDIHSQQIIVSTIELLLNYCTRFYGRQLITRTTANKTVVAEVEAILQRYFGPQARQSLPTVRQLAEQVNLSPGYLSDLLKKETGMHAQEHIHYRLIEEAKQLLLHTDYNISEVAYRLGFEYPQYFNKLFKQKTGKTPTEYRLLH